jgi:leucyl aminopeptidase
MKAKSSKKSSSPASSEWIHPLMNLHVDQDFSGDTVAHFFFQNDKKEAQTHSSTLTEIQDLVKNKVFTATAKSIFFIRASYIEKKNILTVGLGNKTDFSTEKARLTGAIAFQKCQSEKIKHLGLHVDQMIQSLSKAHLEAALTGFLEGFYLASYTFEKYKSQQKPATEMEVTLISEDKKVHALLKEISNAVLTTVDCTFIARDFSNEPSNFGTPVYYANEISTLAKKFGLKCKIMNDAEAKKEKMDLYLSVGAGSARESRVVILEHAPKSAKKTVALVGKGVTFDSGGLSLKPGLRMEDMKHDMSGAANILGATLLAARLGSKNKIVTVLVFCENMPGGKATQPGNVIKSRSGKTVEIFNTDAEGRLILADALDLAQDYKPDVMINAATLTGACSIALGKLVSALFSNDEKLTKQIHASTNVTEEKLWELPMFDEYFDDLKSHYADMSNVANDSNGGTIRGAVFLKQFIKPGQKWAHIDLANTAYDQGYLPYNPRKGASGKYVRTLAHFTMNY